MLKQTLCAAMLLIAFAAFVQAQTPDLPIDDAAASATAPDASPAATPDVVATQGDPADLVITQGMTDCGCQSPSNCGPTCACGASHPLAAWKEKCAYYRSVRQAYDRGPCCGNSFGPLWDTYCADKQRSCTASQPCASMINCRRCGPRPMLSLRHRHRRPTCDTCSGGGATCDCADSAAGVPSEASLDIGQPPEPSEADDPAPAPPKIDTPATPDKTTSARRSWFNRKVGWQRSG